jgi:hypothetical protein
LFYVFGFSFGRVGKMEINEAKRGGAEGKKEDAEKEGWSRMVRILICPAFFSLRSLPLCVSIDLHRLVGGSWLVLGTGFVGEEGASVLRVLPPEPALRDWPNEVRREKFTPAGPRVVLIGLCDFGSSMFDELPTIPLRVGRSGEEEMDWRFVGSLRLSCGDSQSWM